MTVFTPEELQQTATIERSSRDMNQQLRRIADEVVTDAMCARLRNDKIVHGWQGGTERDRIAAHLLYSVKKAPK